MDIEQRAECVLAELDEPLEEDFKSIFSLVGVLFLETRNDIGSLNYHASRILPFLQIHFWGEKKSSWLLDSGILIYKMLIDKLQYKEQVHENITICRDWLYANTMSMTEEFRLELLFIDKYYYDDVIAHDAHIPDSLKEVLPFYYERYMRGENHGF